ncbi:MAG: class I SAM-dependent methyltransferase [Caldilineales bacterium]|nr:class I SAM-dependent methyltransferase [Caldilineales bacterium]
MFLHRAKIRFVNACYRLLHRLYYAGLFGRRLPVADRVAVIVQRWETARRRGDIPQPAAVWDAQYAAGRWDFLAGLDQLARYSVIAGYIHYLKPEAAVLDVGCGEGLLLRSYRPYGYSRYLGVDIAANAVARLSAAADERTHFVCADAETFHPDESFDVIVFNESLYYFREPLTTFARYLDFLNQDGIVIVSTFLGSPRAVSILKRLREKYAVLDEVQIKHNKKLEMVCSVFKPHDDNKNRKTNS